MMNQYYNILKKSLYFLIVLSCTEAQLKTQIQLSLFITIMKH